MRPSISIDAHPNDPTLQVVNFDPPVASWSFSEGKTSDELWRELHQASAALLHENLDAPFDEGMKAQLRARILLVLLHWSSQRWVRFQ